MSQKKHQNIDGLLRLYSLGSANFRNANVDGVDDLFVFYFGLINCDANKFSKRKI